MALGKFVDYFNIKQFLKVMENIYKVFINIFVVLEKIQTDEGSPFVFFFSKWLPVTIITNSKFL